MFRSGNYLIFGASGSIGSTCADKMANHGSVTRGSRNALELAKQIEDISGFDGVIWAQGINAADSPINFERNIFENVMEANVSFILDSLKLLLEGEKLKKNSQLVVLSSVWSQLSRPNKLSYGVSKAALSGLVRSLAVDLGSLGIQINAVCPGPIDTPMTVKNLNPGELERIISEGPLNRLVTLDEVASLICELVTGKLSGVNGQEIVIDGGWSVTKLV